MQEITIQLVTWNSALALKTVMPTLKQVPLGRAALRVIDNASTDDSVALVREHLPAAEIVELPTNTGFAGGHNEGFARCTTPYVLVLNPDVELNWAGVERALDYFEDITVGAVQGKLYRHDTVFDSAGIILTAALNGRDRGAGERDSGQYDQPTSLLAVTGACGLYRLSALQDIQHKQGEIFDQAFQSYKEDVDLGWRLTRAGWQVLYVPHVMGNHERVQRREGAFGWSLQPRKIIKRLRNPRTTLSARNWIWLIMKNARLGQILLHSLFILGRLVVLVVLSLLYWPLLAAWWQAVRGAKAMIAKRSLSG